MWQQVWAICWAQFRISRNRWGRTTWASVLGSLATALWYSAAVAGGVFVARVLPHMSPADVKAKLPVGLLGVFIFWQMGPLFTMSTGWSLELPKLMVYPIRRNAFLGIELLLRITAAPEMIPILLGGIVGLLLNPFVKGWWPLAGFFFLPVNLFLSLAVREFILHGFEKNRFRELFTVLLISLAVVPQLLLRSGLRGPVTRAFLQASHSRWSPWGETALAMLGQASLLDLALLIAWSVLFFMMARFLFLRSLLSEETLRTVAATESRPGNLRRGWAAQLANLFPDPVGALLAKDLSALLRMPRFRVTFGMACVFSVLAFLPIAYNFAEVGLTAQSAYLKENFLVLVNLYGLLILSDALVLNVFGMDRSAAELYFVSPVPLRTVLLAKNAVAAIFVAVQAVLILLLVPLTRMPITFGRVTVAIGSELVVGLFFLAVGNLTSLTIPRPIDPKQTFRKQAGGKITIWLLLCGLGTCVLVGAVLLAEYGFHSIWAGMLVLLFELVVGLIVYWLSLDSAVQRGLQQREAIIAALGRAASPVNSAS